VSQRVVIVGDRDVDGRVGKLRDPRCAFTAVTRCVNNDLRRGVVSRRRG